MKKLIYLPMLLIVFGTGSALAQVCTPVDTFSTPGSGDGSEVSCITQGQQYEGTFYFKAPDSIDIDGGDKFGVDYLIIDTIQNLPCGISWATNNRNGSVPSNKFMSAEDGCIKFKGTTNDSTGLYQLAMGITIKLSQQAQPVKLSPDSLKNKMEMLIGVKSPSDSCQSLDYTQNSPSSGNQPPDKSGGSGSSNSGGSTQDQGGKANGSSGSGSDASTIPDSLSRTSSCYTAWKEATANVEGRIFHDLNGNNSFDANESVLEDWLVKITPNPVYATSNNSGNFHASLDTGNYKIELIAPSYWSITGQKSYSISINNQSDTYSGKDFGVQIDSTVDDLSVDVVSGVPVAGQITKNWVSFENKGTEMKDATVTVDLDSNLTFQSAQPAPKGVSGNIIKWDANDLEVMEKRTIMIKSEVAVVMPETPMQSIATITPQSSDNTPGDNVDTLDQQVFSSYDPNDKLAAPARKMKSGMDANYTLFAEELDYTVRFQNTGNYKASLVRIEDTLDQNLDVSTFKIVGASHEMEYEINGKGNVIFTFKNINLPDSGTDLQGSKGFVKYTVEAKDGIPENTIVRNNAHIYFDYNPAVVTNTTKNTMVNKLPSTITSVESAIESDFKGIVSPNPFNGTFRVNVKGKKVDNYTFELYNMVGKKLKKKEVQGASPVEVSADDLPGGMYLYRIELEDGRHTTGKIMAK